jgi:hypothetical protein
MRRIALFLLLSIAATTQAFALARGNPNSPYACTRLFITNPNDVTSGYDPNFTFTSSTAVCNRFGTGPICSAAQNFFAGTSGFACTPTMVVIRFCALGCRPHYHSGNLASATFATGGGAVNVTLNGVTFQTSSISITGSSTPSSLGSALKSAINGSLPTVAATTGSTLTPESATFTGGESGALLDVTSGLPAGGLTIGAVPCDTPLGAPTLAACTGSGLLPSANNRIIWPAYGQNPTTQNPWQAVVQASYSVLAAPTPLTSPTSPEVITENWMVLTIGTLTSGIISTGSELSGAGITANSLEIVSVASTSGVATCASNPSKCGGRTAGYWCDATLAGACAGTTWNVGGPPAQLGTAISAEAINLTPCSVGVSVDNNSASYVDLDISANDFCEADPGYVTYGLATDAASGNAAAQMELTSATAYPNGWTAISPATVEPSEGDFSSWMNNVLLPQFSQFGSFQNVVSKGCGPISSINYQGGGGLPYHLDPDMSAWSAAQPGNYPFFLGANQGGNQYGSSTPGYCKTGAPLAGFPGAQ